MALQTLIWDSNVPSDSLEVKVAHDCRVTLQGRVRHQYQSDAAYDDVSRLPGVLGVTNKIGVSLPGRSVSRSAGLRGRGDPRGATDARASAITRSDRCAG